MKPESKLRFLALVLLAGVLALPSCDGQTGAQPSVILISIDSLRRDHLGFEGYELDVSPFLDELAQESVVFERAYAPAPWTLVSHMTMLTGLHPGQHGVMAKNQALCPDIPLLAERLADAGYHTVGVTAGGWVGERHGFDRGFSRFQVYRTSSQMVQAVAAALDERPRDRPLFLFIHVWDVHCVPLTRPGSTIYDPPGEDYDELFLPGAKVRLQNIDADALWRAETTATNEQIEAFTALYDGSIRYVDEVIRSWVDAFRSDGLLDSAALIVTSDHGESLWQRHRTNIEHGGFFEEGLRVPLLVRLPGAEQRGRQRTEQVSHVDLVPTILALAGIPVDPWLPGAPILGDLPEHRLVLLEKPPTRGAIQWPYKVLLYREDADDASVASYNLHNSPGEEAPLFAPGGTLLYSRLREGFLETIRAVEESWDATRHRPIRATKMTASEIEGLRELGYLGGS